MAETIDLGRPFEGSGSAHGHHGELLQGVFEMDGRLRRGLTTLPCSLFTSQAHVRFSPDAASLTVRPAWRTKALRAAETTLDALGVGRWGGVLTVSSDTQVGFGFGSSTSDVTATIHAVQNAFRRPLAPERIARIAVDAEVAVDPLMFDRMILFAHREGEVIEDFGVPTCEIELIGFPLGRDPVDTLALPPARYTAQEISIFGELREGLRQAALKNDISEIGAVATASARINQRFLPAPHLSRLLRLVQESGAAGLQVAHSGSVGGLLFDPSDPNLFDKMGMARRGLAELGIHQAWRLST